MFFGVITVELLRMGNFKRSLGDMESKRLYISAMNPTRLVRQRGIPLPSLLFLRWIHARFRLTLAPDRPGRMSSTYHQVSTLTISNLGHTETERSRPFFSAMETSSREDDGWNL